MNENIRSACLGIKKFRKNVISKLNPKCIILYGSLARGDYNERSDIDIIVISSNLPDSYYKRAKLLYSFIDTYDPIEPLGFTPDEFLRMIKKRHCTALFAMDEGKALYGASFFSHLKEIFHETIKKYNLVKGPSAWVQKSVN